MSEREIEMLRYLRTAAESRVHLQEIAGDLSTLGHSQRIIFGYMDLLGGFLRVRHVIPSHGWICDVLESLNKYSYAVGYFNIKK